MLLVAALSLLTLTMQTLNMRDFLLSQAAGSCSAAGAKFLFALGADPRRIGPIGPPLHHAVRCGDPVLRKKSGEPNRVPSSAEGS